MLRKGVKMAPKIEPKTAQKHLRAITEGIQKIVLKLGPKIGETGDPQGPQNRSTIEKIVQEKVPKHRHVSRRVPKRSQGRPGTPF